MGILFNPLSQIKLMPHLLEEPDTEGFDGGWWGEGGTLVNNHWIPRGRACQWVEKTGTHLHGLPTPGPRSPSSGPLPLESSRLQGAG